jgi:hypothetical protein
VENLYALLKENAKNEIWDNFIPKSDEQPNAVPIR